MRNHLLAALAATVAVVTTATISGPAWADPPAGVRPSEFDAVGGGSQFTEYLFDQFSHDYNAAHPVHDASHPHLYNFDAVNPATGAIGGFIKSKHDCPQIPRPYESSAAIAQIESNVKTRDKKYYCLNYANSGRPRDPSDPPFAPGGTAFVVLGQDAITWATQTTTDAPKTLTLVQLAAIYTCQDTNWRQVGGKNAPISPFMPAAGSDLVGLWLKALGNITPGPCVNNDNDTLAENEGVNPLLNSPEAIVPYSVANYIAQRFHSASCSKTGCQPDDAPHCTPSGSQNLFGCDVHGTLKLNSISGAAPTVGTGPSTKISPNFPPTFYTTMFETVPYDTGTTDHIPGPNKPRGGINLEQFFAGNGWACKNPQAIKDLRDYGFVPLGSDCGHTD
jgi:ABC-type phosphate transport system substrate-binding protein